MINKKLQKKVMEVKKELTKYFKGDREISDVFLAGVFSKAKILEWAAHGKGKSLLAELIARLCNCSYSRVQGSSGLTESKLLARYDLSKLLKGEEVVKWREFVTAKIKLLDEINRTHPVLLNSIFSMLQEKIVIVGDERFNVPDYVFIATMNPSDSGTYILPPPLWDRFDICLLLKSLKISDKLDVVKNQPEKAIKQIKPILRENEIDKIWKDVEKVKIPHDIEVFTIALTRDLQLCKYGEKEFLTNFPQCCEECYFKQWICSALDNRYPISERLYLSIFKVSKAYAYLMGRSSVNKDDVLTILKYALFHRLKVTDTYAYKYKNKEEIVNSIISKLIEKDIERSDAYKLIKEIIQKEDTEKMKILKEYAEKDLLLNEMYEEIKQKFMERNSKIISKLKKKPKKELFQLFKQTKDQKIKSIILDLVKDQLVIKKNMEWDDYLKFISHVSGVSSIISKKLRDNPLFEYENITVSDDHYIIYVSQARRKMNLEIHCCDPVWYEDMEFILRRVLNEN